MRNAVTHSNILAMEDSQYQPLNFSDVLYLATRGGARLLDREHELGALEVGQLFDSLLIDMEGDEFILLLSLTLEVNMFFFSANSTTRPFGRETKEELVQKFVFLGNDTNIQTVFVGEKKVKN